MKSLRFRCLLGAVLFILLGGCAALSREQAREAFAPTLDRYREEARTLQEAGRKREAFEKLRVVSSFHSEDADLISRLQKLEKELEASAEARFQRGRKLLEAGKAGAARRELLLALADNPDHEGALDYLKNRFYRDTLPHRVAAGESMESIASRSYGDPAAAVIIRRLNDLGPDEEVRPGAMLLLPAFGELARSPGKETGAASTGAAGMIEGYPVRSEPDEEQSELAVARGYLEAGYFEEALIAAKAIPAEGDAGRHRREVENASHYGRGKELQEEERYLEALSSFENVDPSYRDVKKRISSVQRSIRAKAEEHYLAGVRFFVDQKLKDAVDEWEKTLELNPDHPKAHEDLAKARKLMEQLQKIR